MDTKKEYNKKRLYIIFLLLVGVACIYYIGTFFFNYFDTNNYNSSVIDPDEYIIGKWQCTDSNKEKLTIEFISNDKKILLDYNNSDDHIYGKYSKRETINATDGSSTLYLDISTNEYVIKNETKENQELKLKVDLYTHTKYLYLYLDQEKNHYTCELIK